MKTRISSIALAILLLATFACKKSSQESNVVNTTTDAKQRGETSDAVGILIHQTEFDNSSIVNDRQRDDISGTNMPGFPWTGTHFGDRFRFYYEDGRDTDRKAKIEVEPGTSNNILTYSIWNANVPRKGKARIQADLYNFLESTTNLPHKEIYESVRVKLDANSFQKILNDPLRLKKDATYDSYDWLTLFEFWNNRNWSSTEPFRITVGLKKLQPYDNTNPKFILFADGQDYEGSDWRKTYLWQTSETNAANVIPLGQWMTIEIYIKEGTAGQPNGRFYLAVTVDGGSKQVIADIVNWTQCPTDSSPDGIEDLNPMKLYCSEALINTVKAGSAAPLKVSWDSFKLWKNKQPL